MQRAQLAPNIVIKWDPVTDAGQVRFDLREFMLDDLGKPTAYANINEVDIHFEEVANMAVRVADLTGHETDPVTQQVFPSVVSGAMIMRCIKQMTNVIIREKLEKKIRGGVQPTINNPTANEFVVDMSNNTFIEDDARVDYTVDWGDGTTPDENVTLDTVSHTYADVTEMTEYTITVTVNTQMLSGIVFELMVRVSPVVEEPTPEPTSEPA